MVRVVVAGVVVAKEEKAAAVLAELPGGEVAGWVEMGTAEALMKGWMEE